MRVSMGEGWCYVFVEVVGQVVMCYLMIVRGCVGEACVQEIGTDAWCYASKLASKFAKGGCIRIVKELLCLLEKKIK